MNITKRESCILCTRRILCALLLSLKKYNISNKYMRRITHQKLRNRQMRPVVNVQSGFKRVHRDPCKF